jgi:hypothetical protein
MGVTPKADGKRLCADRPKTVATARANVDIGGAMAIAHACLWGRFH